MIKLTSIKACNEVVADCEYYLGGMIQGSNNIVVMTLQKSIVPGRYDMTEIFGIEKEELMRMILDDNGIEL